MRIRPVNRHDMEALYQICLITGDVGQDASHLYADPKLLGHIYTAPYVEFCPDTCFVAEDALGVAGFVVGTQDTRAFEQRLERDWWPSLRTTYPNPNEDERDDWTADQCIAAMIHNPKLAAEDIVAKYPAHLHLNLLPRIQGQGFGQALVDTWLSNAKNTQVTGVHIGVSPINPRAIRFWRKCKFAPIDLLISPPADTTIWLGQNV